MCSDLEIKRKKNTKSFDFLKLPPQHKIISTLTSITNVGKREVISTSLEDANKQIDSIFFWCRRRAKNKIQKKVGKNVHFLELPEITGIGHFVPQWFSRKRCRTIRDDAAFRRILLEPWF